MSMSPSIKKTWSFLEKIVQKVCYTYKAYFCEKYSSKRLFHRISPLGIPKEQQNIMLAKQQNGSLQLINWLKLVTSLKTKKFIPVFLLPSKIC